MHTYTLIESKLNNNMYSNSSQKSAQFGHECLILDIYWSVVFVMLSDTYQMVVFVLDDSYILCCEISN